MEYPGQLNSNAPVGNLPQCSQYCQTETAALSSKSKTPTAPILTHHRLRNS